MTQIHRNWYFYSQGAVAREGEQTEWAKLLRRRS